MTRGRGYPRPRGRGRGDDRQRGSGPNTRGSGHISRGASPNTRGSDSQNAAGAADGRTPSGSSVKSEPTNQPEIVQGADLKPKAGNGRFGRGYKRKALHDEIIEGKDNASSAGMQ